MQYALCGWPVPLADAWFGNGALGAAFARVASEAVMLIAAQILLPRGIMTLGTWFFAGRVLLAGGVLIPVSLALLRLALAAGGGRGWADLRGGAVGAAGGPPVRRAGGSDLGAGATSPASGRRVSAGSMKARRATPRNGKTDHAAPATTDAEQRPYPGLHALIQSDVAAWTDTYAGWDTVTPGSPFTLLRLVFVFAGLRATLIQRVAYELYRRWVPLLPTLLSGLNVTLHGFEMSPYAEVGPRFYVPHPVGTVVVAERMGSNVTLVSNVTIGRRKKPGFPAIGDDVYVGAGARILGALTIGDRVQIGANAVVLTDVPDDSVAVGVPVTVRPGQNGAVGRPGALRSPCPSASV